MRRLFAIAVISGFVSLLGAGSVIADPFTLCVKDRKGKLNRGALGELPAKGECKNVRKWTAVTLATEDNIDDLQAQIDDLRDFNISSMIGGSHKEKGDVFGLAFFGMPMFGTRLVELTCDGTNPDNPLECEPEGWVQQKLTASGVITKMSVVVDEGPGEGDFSLYNLRIDGADVPLFPGSEADFSCSINGTNRMCTVTSDIIPPCVPVEMDQLISVVIAYLPSEGNFAKVRPARWNARFVEGGKCRDIPPPPPDNICTDFECPEDSSLICDPEVGLTCEGPGASCLTENCPDGTFLQQCGEETFTCLLDGVDGDSEVNGS